MTEELKDLVVKDLYARIPYGVMVEYSVDAGSISCIDTELEADDIREFMDPESDVTIKPYLRPMSSLDKAEREYVEELSNFKCTPDKARDKIDFFLERHVDFRGLIEMGAALEAPEGMYKF